MRSVDDGGSLSSIFDVSERSKCFYKIKLSTSGQIYGPITVGEIKQLIQQNQVSEQDHISVPSETEWKAIKTIGYFNSYLQMNNADLASSDEIISGIHNEISGNSVSGQVFEVSADIQDK